MKKILYAIFVFVLVITLCACGENVNENNTDVKNNENVNDSTQTAEVSTNSSTNETSSNEEKITFEALNSSKETKAEKFLYEEIEGKISITSYIGDDEIVVIPQKIENNDVAQIGKDAFSNNDTIKAVKLANTVEVVGNEAFINCYSLELFVSGNGLKKIGDYAFAACNSLTNVYLNDGLVSLGLSCFYATKLKEIIVPSSVTNINYAFPESDKEAFTIIAETGSPAETFALENGYNFQEK